MNLEINTILANDSYKLSHAGQVPGVCTQIYSHLTPRSVHYLKKDYPNMEDKVVVYGTQMTVKILTDRWDKYFFNKSWEEVSEDTLNVLTGMLGYSEEDLVRFKELHDLGYLPLRFKALAEGSWVNQNIPILTVTNTLPNFYWLTNFIEPTVLNTIFKPMTVATLGLEIARLRNKYFDLTVSDQSGKDFALHDFSYRGHSGHNSAAETIGAYLLYTKGTDTMSAVKNVQQYYKAGNNVAGSICAFEHSTATLGIQYYKDVLDQFYAIPGADVKAVGDELIAKEEEKAPLTEDQLHDIYFEVRAELLHKTLTSISLEAVKKGLRAALWVDLQLVDKPLEERKLAIGEVFNLARILVDVYPTGLFAYVADSYDYNRLIAIILPALKELILARDGKFVIRPDSSDPVEIINGTTVSSVSDEAAKEVLTMSIGQTFSFEGNVYVKVKHPPVAEGTFLPFFLLVRNGFVSVVDGLSSELNVKAPVVASIHLGSIRSLAEVFGTTTNAKGYKELPPQIGLVYGDGMSYDRINRIYEGLKNNGYAASNVVLALGGYTLAHLSRDSLGFAIKASYAKVDGKDVATYKRPATDLTKSSQAGLFKVVKEDNGDYKLFTNVTPQEEQEGELKTIWEDGKFVLETTFNEIQARLPL